MLNMIPPQGNWGRITHLYSFRSKEPVMGKGGRLVPDLKTHLKGLDSPTPRSFITNSQGFRNKKEFINPKKKEEYRIINLGDSYSIGYHLDQTSFLGPLLENKLRSEPDNNINVLNAAISDPAYGLYYFQHYGLEFNPDIVILSLCGNDFVQSYSFSGPGQRFHLVNNKLEINPDYRNFVNATNKFKEYVYTTGEPPPLIDGNNLNKKHSKYLPVYSLIGFQNLSIIRKLKLMLNIQIIDSPRYYEILKYENQVRMIDGFPNIGFYYKKDIKPVSEMYETSYNLFKSFKQICDKYEIQFVLLYFPTPFEVIPSEWQRICSSWGLNPSDFELSKHRNTISKFAEENDILFVDTTDELIKSGKKEELFLPLDAHFTESAHKIIADLLAEEIICVMK